MTPALSDAAGHPQETGRGDGLLTWWRALRARQPGRSVARVLGWYFLHGLCALYFYPLYRYRAWGIHNIPEAGPVLLVSNHQSLFDPILVGLGGHHRQFYAMARSSLFRFSFFARLIGFLNAIPIDRGEADMAAIRKSLGVLDEGQALLVFAEGTRSPDGRVQPLQAGTMLLVRRSGAPVVPVAIDGAQHIWPKGRKLPRAMGRVGVMYGKPIPAARLQAMKPAEALEHLRMTIEAMRLEVNDRLRTGRGV